MKYVKLPIPIDAWEIIPGDTNPPDWVESALALKLFNLYPHPTVATLEGVMSGNIGDYLIQGVEKELYICAKRVFERTYTEWPATIDPQPDDAKEDVDGPDVIDVRENADGSVTMSLKMDVDTVLSFARIGFDKVLGEALDEAEQFKPLECGFADEDVTCAQCTCWKKQNA